MSIKHGLRDISGFFDQLPDLLIRALGIVFLFQFLQKLGGIPFDLKDSGHAVVYGL